MAEIQDVPNSSPNTDSPPLPPDAATAQEEMAVRTQQERSATGPRTPATAENGSEPVIENKLKVPPLPLHAPVRSTTSSHPFQHLVPSPPPTPSNLAPTDMAPPDVPPRPTDGSTSTVDPESALLQYLPSGNLGPGQDASSSKETRALFSMFLDDSRPDDRIQRADPRGPQSYQTKSAQHAAYAQSSRLSDVPTNFIRLIFCDRCQANFDYKGNSKCLQWQGPNDGEVLLRTVARAYGVSLRSASNPNGKLIYLTSKDTNEVLLERAHSRPFPLMVNVQIIDVDTEFAYDNKDLIVHVEPEDGENAFCGVPVFVLTCHFRHDLGFYHEHPASPSPPHDDTPA
eukprot:255466-Hanusia_phi.AAC.1